MGEIEVLNLGTTQRRVLITVVDQCCRSKFCAVIEDKATRGIKGSSPNLPPPLPKIYHIFYNDETWHTNTLPEED